MCVVHRFALRVNVDELVGYAEVLDHGGGDGLGMDLFDLDRGPASDQGGNERSWVGGEREKMGVLDLGLWNWRRDWLQLGLELK